MLNDETKRKLRELKLGELIESYDIYSKGLEWNSLSFEQKFQMLTDYLFQEKYNNSVKLLLSKAKLRIPKADVTSLIYDGRGIDRSLITELSSCGTYLLQRISYFRALLVPEKRILHVHSESRPSNSASQQSTSDCLVYLLSMMKKCLFGKMQGNC